MTHAWCLPPGSEQRPPIVVDSEEAVVRRASEPVAVAADTMAAAWLRWQTYVRPKNAETF
jgi:hypothetical protein